jgi:hemerythrin
MLSDWSEHLVIDHAEIDRDHKTIIGLMELLYKMPDQLFSFSQVEDQFTDLLDFMAVHFNREESIMEEHDYPGKDAHTKEHTSLLEIYGTFFYEKNAKTEAERRRILEDLSMILIDHIKEFDRPLARFCQDSSMSVEDTEARPGSSETDTARRFH